MRRLLSCLFGSRRSCCCQQCVLGGYDLKRLCWANAGICKCELNEQMRLTEEGFEEWRTDAVSVSARFMNTSEVPCDFRGKPIYLKCQKCFCSKVYVLLGVSCVGDVMLELDCTTLKCGKSFYSVCRVAYICK